MSGQALRRALGAACRHPASARCDPASRFFWHKSDCHAAAEQDFTPNTFGYLIGLPFSFLPRMPLDVLDLDQCTLCANISYAEQPHARNSLSRAMLLKATMVFNLVAFLVALIQPASAFQIKRLRTDRDGSQITW